jgi:hypothetical protein
MLQPSPLKKFHPEIYKRRGSIGKRWRVTQHQKREWNINTIDKGKIFPVFHATSLFNDRSISPCIIG